MTNQATQINVLPKDVSALLAAGQVIDSPEAVIRELVENSLDAAANRIFITLWPESWRLQVADNGYGMTLENLRLACAPHSTSKIQTESDLHKIKTLGFRGEALYSLAQLADLEILSRPIQETSRGWKIIYTNGTKVDEAPVAIAPGTIVKVQNLFSNWEVRREVIAATPQRLKTLHKIISDMALSNPQVHWQIRVEDKLWLKISPSQNPKEIIPQLLKAIHSQDLGFIEFPIASPHPGEKITLVLGLPDRCHRQRPDWIKIAVNGRVVKSPLLEQTVINTTARILPRDRYPLCFVHLHINPEQIDWNRHPAKSEVYIQASSFYQEQIRQAMEKLLRLNPDYLSQGAKNQRVQQLFKAAEKPQSYQIDPQVSDHSIQLIPLKAVGQINRTYIVVEHSHGLWLVEQHIAHERVLYEQLQDNWQLVPLSQPIILERLSTRHREQLQSLGIEVESFGEKAWIVRNAPAMLVEREDCADALQELSQGGDLEAAQVATACRSAIRNGTYLDLNQMQQLIQQWQATRNPRTCPHGRPIYLALEESSLARFFRRHWVIGKSHGI